MRICYFADARAIHIKRWAKYFAGRGNDVHLITFNPDILDGYEPVKVHLVKKRIPKQTLTFRILNVLPMIFDLKTVIKNIEPDIIHSHSIGGYGYLPMLLGFHPFIITPWGNDIFIDIENSKIERFLTKLTLKKADLITCDGENTKEAMINLGISSQKIKFITFGVDIQKFKPDLKSKNFKEKVVISTRFLTDIHDVETFIKAIPLVLEKTLNVKFVIIGSGPQKEYLMDLSKTLNIFNTVEFVGEVSENEMIRYLQSADVYVSTSLSESGLAASTAEAMACELPVINTNTGDIGLWIKDGEGGFIVPVKNPAILAEKIIYLLKNDEERIKFGKNNRKVIEERNNYYIEMEKMENIYQDLIEKRIKR